MSKRNKAVSIAAVVYILTAMWIFQGEAMSLVQRIVTAVLFFVVLAFVAGWPGFED